MIFISLLSYLILSYYTVYIYIHISLLVLILGHFCSPVSFPSSLYLTTTLFPSHCVVYSYHILFFFISSYCVHLVLCCSCLYPTTTIALLQLLYTYYTSIPYYTVPYHTMPHYTLLYPAILYYTMIHFPLFHFSSFFSCAFRFRVKKVTILLPPVNIKTTHSKAHFIFFIDLCSSHCYWFTFFSSAHSVAIVWLTCLNGVFCLFVVFVCFLCVSNKWQCDNVTVCFCFVIISFHLYTFCPSQKLINYYSLLMVMLSKCLYCFERDSIRGK